MSNRKIRGERRERGAVSGRRALARRASIVTAPTVLDSATQTSRLTRLTDLASVPIETSLVGDLSQSLHRLFDPVCETPLPIYFGPLLGRLYLEGL
jgi:hypothetical protein